MTTATKYAAEQALRTVRFRPYRKGMGPTFTLQMWDTYQSDGRGYGGTKIAYKLTMREPGAKRAVVLFAGDDYGCGMGTCIDSDESVRALMGYLTCKPGDTDAEFFASYTPEQLAYCDAHAEALALAVMDRFGEG